jgi:hypothetical protein
MKFSHIEGLTPLNPGNRILLHLQPVVARMSCSMSEMLRPSLR